MRWTIKIGFLLICTCASIVGRSQTDQRPNVLLIITDDQGYGDLGIHGNPYVQTPTLDALAEESIQFTDFYVSPVCAPTRASLMTGRYSLRTGIRDTYNGGAIMASEEWTIAEVLQQANYQTGIFGKWHLGDNYPSRPSDQGFDESVVHLSGGMGQVGDVTTYFQKDSSYFDPVLWHNNKQQAYEGYCSDIFAQEAIRFIEMNKNQPFFCYLSFNAPHTPLQVPKTYYDRYKDIDPTSKSETDKQSLPEMSERDQEDARKVYAMVENIDDNVNQVLQKLEELSLAKETIVIFLTDNGPQQRRYVAGLRSRKGSVYQGGVKVPMFFRYPALYATSRKINTTTAHIDILPTLAELCQVTIPDHRQLDGESLMPLLNQEAVDWEDRPLFFYWSRRYPELYHNVALRKGDYKLVGMTSYDGKIEDFELYHLTDDPYENNNLILKETVIAKNYKATFDQLYYELIQSTHLIDAPRIVIGTPYENPTILNRNDAGGERGIWAQEEVYGKWAVDIQEGTYDFTFQFLEPIEPGGKLYLELNGMIFQRQNDNDKTDRVTLKSVALPATLGDLIPFYSINRKRIFPFWVEIKRLE